MPGSEWDEIDRALEDLKITPRKTTREQNADLDAILATLNVDPASATAFDKALTEENKAQNDVIQAQQQVAQAWKKAAGSAESANRSLVDKGIHIGKRTGSKPNVAQLLGLVEFSNSSPPTPKQTAGMISKLKAFLSKLKIKGAKTRELEQYIKNLEKADEKQAKAKQAVNRKRITLKRTISLIKQKLRRLNVTSKPDKNHVESQKAYNDKVGSLKRYIRLFSKELSNNPELLLEPVNTKK